MTKINGKSCRSKRPKKNTHVRMCLICGEGYEAAINEEGAICPTCRAEYGLSLRKKNEFPCNKRKICQKCAHRIKMSCVGESGYVCLCLNHTGQVRDLTGDDTHCKTFEQKGLRHYYDGI